MKDYKFTVRDFTFANLRRQMLVTAHEYPWSNHLVVYLSSEPHKREDELEKLRDLYGWTAFAEDHDEFCAVIAGGGAPGHETLPYNAKTIPEVSRELRACLQAAVDFWAKSDDCDFISNFL